MKFCENCGTQLADDAVFCEECGTKQETVAAVTPQIAEKPSTSTPSAAPVQETVTSPVAPAINSQPALQEIKLSETCVPSKRQIKDWVFIALLILCSPLISVNLILWLPEFLFWIVFVGSQIAVLANMWFKRNWKGWIKIAITVAYILMYII